MLHARWTFYSPMTCWLAMAVFSSVHKHVRMARESVDPHDKLRYSMCNRVKDMGPVKSNSEAILMQFEDGTCKHGIPL